MATFSNYDENTNVDAWLDDYASDPNLLWRTDHDHVKNVVDELLARAVKAYRRGRQDAAGKVREELNLPTAVFPENELTTRFIRSIIQRCAEQAEGEYSEEKEPS